MRNQKANPAVRAGTKRTRRYLPYNKRIAEIKLLLKEEQRKRIPHEARIIELNDELINLLERKTISLCGNYLAKQTETPKTPQARRMNKLVGETMRMFMGYQNMKVK